MVARLRPSTVATRHGALDALRGTAVLWMTCFHFAFDLNHFGFIHENFYGDPLWTVQRTCILSLFLLCAGFGQAVAVPAVRGRDHVVGSQWPAGPHGRRLLPDGEVRGARQLCGCLQCRNAFLEQANSHHAPEHLIRLRVFCQ